MKKFFVTFLLLGLLVYAAPMYAQTTTSTSTDQVVQSLKALIEQLKAQIEQLQLKMQALMQARQEVRQEAQETRDVLKNIIELRRGMSADEIRAIQQILAEDPSIYPEGLITGYFGTSTERALNRFREKHGILDEKGGVLGEKTLKKLQELLRERRIIRLENGKKCLVVPPGHLVAPGLLKKSTSTPNIPECQVLPKGIEKLLQLELRLQQSSTTPTTTATSTNTSTSTSDNTSTTTTSTTTSTTTATSTNQ
jgi:peptidoglycan hydrolase-like protein with peptidoglycan-binding domain